MRRLNDSRPIFSTSISKTISAGPDGQTRLLTWIQGEVPHDPIRLQDEGGIDFPLVFEGLEAIGYDGYVTVHQAFREIMEPEDAAEQSYTYLKPLCA